MGKWINLDDLPSGRVEWDDIFDAPSIDLVQCKECKHWKWIEWAKEYRCTVRNTAFNARADDYCSYGVRKTNTTVEEKPTPIRDYMVHRERKGE